jgi:farnesyl-diphosphate farnesyltransferase
MVGYASLPGAELRRLGRSFGCGLQLVNILRDAGADLADGRCYFPADELAAAGLSPDAVATDPRRLLPVWQRWQAAAACSMRDGITYALAVRNRRPRAAAALPALLGARTLALLHAAGPRGLSHRLKVPRREVHAVLARTILSLASRRMIAAQFERLRPRGEPGWDNPRR